MTVGDALSGYKNLIVQFSTVRVFTLQNKNIGVACCFTLLKLQCTHVPRQALPVESVRVGGQWSLISSIAVKSSVKSAEWCIARHSVQGEECVESVERGKCVERK